MRGALSQWERPLWGRPAVAERYFARARQRRARARAQSRKALPSAPNQAKRALFLKKREIWGKPLSLVAHLHPFDIASTNGSMANELICVRNSFVEYICIANL